MVKASRKPRAPPVGYEGDGGTGGDNEESLINTGQAGNSDDGGGGGAHRERAGPRAPHRSNYLELRTFTSARHRRGVAGRRVEGPATGFALWLRVIASASTGWPACSHRRSRWDNCRSSLTRRLRALSREMASPVGGPVRHERSRSARVRRLCGPPGTTGSSSPRCPVRGHQPGFHQAEQRAVSGCSLPQPRVAVRTHRFLAPHRRHRDPDPDSESAPFTAAQQEQVEAQADLFYADFVARVARRSGHRHGRSRGAQVGSCNTESTIWFTPENAR